MVGLVLGHDRTEDHFNERTDTTLTGRWIGYDKHLIVQSALLLRLVIVVVMATGSQRAVEAGTAEEDGWIGGSRGQVIDFFLQKVCEFP
jgi:hypothetical protein